jgi:hypothetical protein
VDGGVSPWCHTDDPVQVRCDGNKESCKRCVDKRLSCVYSESRVGKVVGKRRKRPLEETATTSESEAWIVTQQQINSIPSPAATTSSAESSSKRHCSDNSWTYFLADDQDLLEGTEAGEALQSINMANSNAFAMPVETLGYGSNGLQTPGLSPPHQRYLSPAAFDRRPLSRQASVGVDNQAIQQTTLMVARTRMSATPQPEDEETVCIKLLSHLKKSSAAPLQHRQVQVDLLAKSSASVRRILRSQGVRKDYSCQLLLSSILTHMATLCELLCGTSSESRGRNEPSRPGPSTSDTFDARTGQTQNSFNLEALRPLVLECSSLTNDLGDMLKRKPLNGFQTLGRHERHLAELQLRLKSVLMSS